jgi:Fe-S-cluster containining protein
MQRSSVFSYNCRCCGRCCHDKVITLAPYDVMRIAEAAGAGTAGAISRFTARRGSLLRFGSGGGCTALGHGLCGIHQGRPLSCRLYPLGLERTPDGERFVELEPAPGSKGIYGTGGTVGGFLDSQGVSPYLSAVESYAALVPLMRERINGLADFEKIEPSEFRRVAVREALAESGYDYNPLIEAIYDSDPWSGYAVDGIRSTQRHVAALRQLIEQQNDPLQVAPAAVLMAVSLGYTPAEALRGV